MPISPISFPTMPLPGVSGANLAGATTSAAAPSGDASGFAKVLASSVDQVQSMQSKTDTLAVQAATGDLRDVHDYTIASTESGLATEMLVAVRNKAVEAFNEIMKMPV
ncbi:flagellar hook-basal body complex protein FliE [Tessaracoccus sp.]